MVAGVDRFRAHFSGHEHQYVLIGDAACELIMEEVGLDFRATKDLDIVLIVEALDPAFSETFMAFVEASPSRRVPGSISAAVVRRARRSTKRT